VTFWWTIECLAEPKKLPKKLDGGIFVAGGRRLAFVKMMRSEYQSVIEKRLWMILERSCKGSFMSITKRHTPDRRGSVLSLLRSTLGMGGGAGLGSSFAMQNAFQLRRHSDRLPSSERAYAVVVFQGGSAQKGQRWTITTRKRQVMSTCQQQTDILPISRSKCHK
jgi:hypothetical protein